MSLRPRNQIEDQPDENVELKERLLPSEPSSDAHWDKDDGSTDERLGWGTLGLKPVGHRRRRRLLSFFFFMVVLITLAACYARDLPSPSSSRPSPKVIERPPGMKIIGLVFYGRRHRVRPLDCYIKVFHLSFHASAVGDFPVTVC
jgi:hypothetical protein